MNVEMSGLSHLEMEGVGEVRISTEGEVEITFGGKGKMIAWMLEPAGVQEAEEQERRLGGLSELVLEAIVSIRGGKHPELVQAGVCGLHGWHQFVKMSDLQRILNTVVLEKGEVTAHKLGRIVREELGLKTWRRNDGYVVMLDGNLLEALLAKRDEE